MSPTIEVNLADILNKIDQRLDRMEQSNSQRFDRIEQSNSQRFDRLEQSVNDLKVNSARLEGKVEAIDAKIDGLDKRIVNQEFINRSVLAALIVGIIGGFAKLFGFIDKV
jgi:DNA anti-recombination protein RmuC